MPIDGSTLPHGEPIYTFVARDGYNIHIHAERLRVWLASSGHRIEPVPVMEPLVQEFYRDNVIDQARCLELLGKDRLDPIIMADTERDSHPTIPRFLLVDGHHRYALAHMMRLTHIPAYIVRKRIWQKFRVYNVRNLSQDELRAVPIPRRDY